MRYDNDLSMSELGYAAMNERMAVSANQLISDENTRFILINKLTNVSCNDCYNFPLLPSSLDGLRIWGVFFVFVSPCCLTAVVDGVIIFYCSSSKDSTRKFLNYRDVFMI